MPNRQPLAESPQLTLAETTPEDGIGDKRDQEKKSRSLALVQDRARAFLESIRAGTRERMKREELYERMAEVIFAYWAAKLHHRQTVFDPKRQKRIMARLRESQGDWGLLCYAVDGALRDDFLMGRDDRANRRYDGIETIFRDRAQVERLAEICPAYERGMLHPLVEKYQYQNGNGRHAE